MDLTPLRRLCWIAMACLILFSSAPAQQAPAPSPKPAPAESSDRLFQAFVEDGVIVPNQWWEGDVIYADDDTSAFLFDVRGAIRPVGRLEIGGRVGFGVTNAPSSYAWRTVTVPGVGPTAVLVDESAYDGSGATDLDVHVKWLAGTIDNKTDIAVGGVVTVPTGDETAGLGWDAFALEGFGAIRYRAPGFIVSGHLGLRLNGDGSKQGEEFDGKISGLLGGGVIFPISDRFSVMAELNAETARFYDLGTDARLLGGVQWRVGGHGLLRGAVALGITSDAPDAQVTVGYAYTF